jgi:DMSO/TMAO reductase YedYZ heme-binding membrane subunit
MDLATFELYAIIVFGILLWLAIVFQALTGLRVVRFKGPLHWRVHRTVAYLLIVAGPLHGAFAVGHFVFGWF